MTGHVARKKGKKSYFRSDFSSKFYMMLPFLMYFIEERKRHKFLGNYGCILLVLSLLNLLDLLLIGHQPMEEYSPAVCRLCEVIFDLGLAKNNQGSFRSTYSTHLLGGIGRPKWPDRRFPSKNAEIVIDALCEWKTRQHWLRMKSDASIKELLSPTGRRSVVVALKKLFRQVGYYCCVKAMPADDLTWIFAVMFNTNSTCGAKRAVQQFQKLL